MKDKDNLQLLYNSTSGNECFLMGECRFDMEVVLYFHGWDLVLVQNVVEKKTEGCNVFTCNNIELKPNFNPSLHRLLPTDSYLPLSRCYCTIWLRWSCLGAHITLLSSMNWNLKKGSILHGPPSRACFPPPPHLFVLFEEPHGLPPQTAWEKP